jgi:hypothetical protein
MAITANPEIEAMANQLAARRGQSVENVLAAALRAELAEPSSATNSSRLCPSSPPRLWPKSRSNRLGARVQ